MTELIDCRKGIAQCQRAEFFAVAVEECVAAGFRTAAAVLGPAYRPSGRRFVGESTRPRHRASDTQGVRAWSKWFGRYLRDVGIKDRSKVFHSFRHGFKDALRSGKVGRELHDALTGHSTRGDVSQDYGSKDMTVRFGWETLAEAIAKAGYPGLDFTKLKRTAPQPSKQRHPR